MASPLVSHLCPYVYLPTIFSGSVSPDPSTNHFTLVRGTGRRLGKVAVTSVLLPTATFDLEPSPITMSMSGVLNLQEE